MTSRKNDWAKTPPMGWNSWDCYGASVTEEEVRGNAEYMAAHLKEYGWEYVVVDIQWYEPTADSSAYHPFVPLEMDEYGRLIPAVNRFPSAAGGAGFKPLADYVHSLGLKFGIHIMRGIPRQAVHAAAPVKGCGATAREIAHPFSVCSWNTDMYGVNPDAYGAQQYYDSLMELYAGWGVDFIKVDDICVTFFSPDNLYSAEAEIELIRRAIDKCGRPIVLSLSLGPAIVERAEHLKANANMWRMTNDYWDRWSDLTAMFERCEAWQGIGGPGCWPDCDMLPLGRIGIRSVDQGNGDRMTRFTHDEQKTMMTLWCIFRSPLMFGGELRSNDEWTLNLLTNPQVLEIHRSSHGAHPLSRNGKQGYHYIWMSYHDNESDVYAALFNHENIPVKMEATLDRMGLGGSWKARELWDGVELGVLKESIVDIIPAHGVKLYKLSPVSR